MSSTGQECLNHLRFPEKEAVYWHVVARGGKKIQIIHMERGYSDNTMERGCIK